MAFNLLRPASKDRPKYEDQTYTELSETLRAVRATFSIQTWLAMGAFAQTLLLLLPIRTMYAASPAALYLLFRFVQGLLITHNILPNPYLQDSILHKFTATVPQVDGSFPTENKPSSNQSVTILLLIIKSNHPFGLVGAPHARKVRDLFTKMRDEIERLPPSETGFLGESAAKVESGNGCVEIVNISYWRSAAHVLKYAESPLHRETVNWWNKHVAELSHIGIGHEVYESPAGMWENVYLNFQPTLMGATTHLRQNKDGLNWDGDAEWIRPLLDARKGRFVNSRGRMGRDLKLEGLRELAETDTQEKQ